MAITVGLHGAAAPLASIYSGSMCASYGLDSRVPGWQEFWRDVVGLATLESLTGWADRNGGETIRPTGVRARNVNPILRGGGFELGWWGCGPCGVPAKYPTINARSETLLSRATWREGYRHRRALIPATEWYEYQKPSKRRYALSTGSALMIGAVTAQAETDEGTISCYSMIMQPSLDHFSHVHDRMPLLIQPELAADWLDPDREGDQAMLDVMLAGSRAIARGVSAVAA